MFSRMRSWLRPTMNRTARRIASPQLPAVEFLEQREVLSTALHFDFGTASSPVAPGYTGVSLTSYSAARGYGWASLTGLSAVNRNSADALTRDFITGSDATFLADLPSGTYDVMPILGDAKAAHDGMSLWAEGTQLASGLSTAAGQYLRPSYRVQVADGQLNLRVADLGGPTRKFAIDGLDVVYVPGPDTTPPTVSLTSPAGGAAVGGTVSVSANASDDVGVVGVQFLIDGAPLGAEDTAAPYSVSWDTTTVANGSHTLSARARDAAGN